MSFVNHSNDHSRQLPHPRPPQDVLLRPLALDQIVLPLGLCLSILLGLLSSPEPPHDAVLQLIAIDGPKSTPPAAVRLGVDPSYGEAAGCVPKAPVLGQWDQLAVALYGGAAPDAAGGHGWGGSEYK